MINSAWCRIYINETFYFSLSARRAGSMDGRNYYSRCGIGWKFSHLYFNGSFYRHRRNTLIFLSRWRSDHSFYHSKSTQKFPFAHVSCCDCSRIGNWLLVFSSFLIPTHRPGRIIAALLPPFSFAVFGIR